MHPLGRIGEPDEVASAIPWFLLPEQSWVTGQVLAVEWVELPNPLEMSQHADGGLMASKPYVATGKYIQRMSNYCAGCRYDPGQRTRPSACPSTILYYDFLLRHEKRLARNQRMAMQLKNLARFQQADRLVIREHAGQIRHQCLSQ